MKYLLVVISALLSSLCNGQEKIYVLDSSTNCPIPYATIKYMEDNNGTYSNVQGKFLLPENINEISVSCIGYETKILKKAKDTIFLKPKINYLDEIIVKPRHRVVYGENKTKHRIGFNSNSESVIFAKKIYLKNNASIVKAHFDIQNDGIKRKYRLLILNLDSVLLPNKNILHKNIVSEMEPNQKGVIIDLTTHNFNLERGTYYLAIEIFDLAKEKFNSSLKIGCYQTKHINESISKPVFNDNEQWKSIKTFNGKKEYAFNFYFTIE